MIVKRLDSPAIDMSVQQMNCLVMEHARCAPPWKQNCTTGINIASFACRIRMSTDVIRSSLGIPVSLFRSRSHARQPQDSNAGELVHVFFYAIIFSSKI